jgi:hypothetical protein
MAVVLRAERVSIVSSLFEFVHRRGRSGEHAKIGLGLNGLVSKPSSSTPGDVKVHAWSSWWPIIFHFHHIAAELHLMKTG